MSATVLVFQPIESATPKVVVYADYETAERDLNNLNKALRDSNGVRSVALFRGEYVYENNATLHPVVEVNE